MQYLCYISSQMQDNLDIFPLISQNDIVNNNKLTLSILKIIGQCDVKHIMRLSIKNQCHRTCCDTSDNVCLNLHNCCSCTYMYIYIYIQNERDPPLFTSKLLIKFQNILRNTTQVIIRHRVKSLFSVISSPITPEWQK